MVHTTAAQITSFFESDGGANSQRDFCVSKCYSNANLKFIELNLHGTGTNLHMSLFLLHQNHTALMWMAFVENNVILDDMQIYAFKMDQNGISVRISVNWAPRSLSWYPNKMSMNYYHPCAHKYTASSCTKWKLPQTCCIQLR